MRFKPESQFYLILSDRERGLYVGIHTWWVTLTPTLSLRERGPVD